MDSLLESLSRSPVREWLAVVLNHSYKTHSFHTGAILEIVMIKGITFTLNLLTPIPRITR